MTRAGRSDAGQDFARAVSHEMARVRRLAARLAAAGDADDVVQNALVRAWRYRDGFDPSRGTFGSWLMAIVANEARRASARPAKPHRSPAAAATSLDERLDVESAVKDLPARQRLAVDCFYFVGLSVAETAVVMGCSEGTVKSTLADARSQLRKKLEVEPG